MPAAERVERGIALYAQGDLEAAAVEFEAALALEPGHATARQFLSWVRERQGAPASRGSSPWDSPSPRAAGVTGVRGKALAELLPTHDGEMEIAEPLGGLADLLEPSPGAEIGAGPASHEDPLAGLEFEMSGPSAGPQLEMEAEPPSAAESGNPFADLTLEGPPKGSAEPHDNDAHIELPPLESADHPPGPANTGLLTNPFIQSERFRDYAAISQRRFDESALTSTTAGEQFAFTGVRAALDRGRPDQALDAAESAVAAAGGLAGCSTLHTDLEAVYLSTLGSLERVPVAAAEAMRSRDLDPKSAFILTRCDGMMSCEEVLEVCGMPRLEALRQLAVLLRRGLLEMR